MDRTKGAPRRRDGAARYAPHAQATSDGRASLTLRTGGERNARAFTLTFTATRDNGPKANLTCRCSEKQSAHSPFLLALHHSQKRAMSLTFNIRYAPLPDGTSHEVGLAIRREHSMYPENGTVPPQGWLVELPLDGQVKDGVPGVLPGVIAKAVMHYVSLDAAADRAIVAGIGTITEEAWNRYLVTISQIQGSGASTPKRLGAMYEEVESALAKATTARTPRSVSCITRTLAISTRGMGVIR